MESEPATRGFAFLLGLAALPVSQQPAPCSLVASEAWRWWLCPLHLLEGTSRFCFQLSAVTDEAVGSSGVQVSL